jgi:hypothetical protein
MWKENGGREKEGTEEDRQSLTMHMLESRPTVP